MRRWRVRLLALGVFFLCGISEAASEDYWYNGLPPGVRSVLPGQGSSMQAERLRNRFRWRDSCIEFQRDRGFVRGDTYELLRYRVMPCGVDSDGIAVSTWQPEKLYWFSRNGFGQVTERRFALVRVRQKKYGKIRHGWRWQELQRGTAEFSAEEAVIGQIFAEVEKHRNRKE